MNELRRAPGSFLAAMPESTSEELLRTGTRQDFGAGRCVLGRDVAGYDGSPVDVVVILNGFVKITSGGALTAVRVPGDVVGDPMPGPSERATACGPVRASVVRRAHFEEFRARHSDAAAQLGLIADKTLAWTSKRRPSFGAYPAEVRMARVLVELARSCGRPAPDGIELAVSLTQAELASMVGVVEPTAQRAMRELRELGLVSTGYRRVAIADLDALRVAAELD